MLVSEAALVAALPPSAFPPRPNSNAMTPWAAQLRSYWARPLPATIMRAGEQTQFRACVTDGAPADVA